LEVWEMGESMISSFEAAILRRETRLRGVGFNESLAVLAETKAGRRGGRVGVARGS
jgi:hypothetical protein